MKLRALAILAILAILAMSRGFCTVLSTVHGVVHDGQHFPVKGANVFIRSAQSSFEVKAVTGPDGSFDLNSVPLGVYRVQVVAEGFTDADQVLTVQSNTHAVLHFALEIANVKTTVTPKHYLSIEPQAQ